MNQRVAFCRTKERECNRLGLTATDMAVRLMFLELAQQWRELGDFLETETTEVGAPLRPACEK